MNTDTGKLGWRLRLILLGAGIAGLSLLLMAAVLKPNPMGFGTHQQLGLPPCGFRLVWGRPCPSCGMTTSWSLFMNGQVWSSLQVNPAGTWLAVWALVLSVWITVAAIAGRWRLVQPNVWFFMYLAITTLIIILTVWFIRFY